MGNMSCIVLLSPTSSLSALVGLLQVQQSLEKIARLEQEKEHWLLEAQLGKVRLEKENQRISDLEAQLAAALGGSPAAQSAAAGTLTQSHEETESESAAAGKELTLCTSLVSVPARVPPRRGSTFECRLVFVFMCFFAKLYLSLIDIYAVCAATNVHSRARASCPRAAPSLVLTF